VGRDPRAVGRTVPFVYELARLPVHVFLRYWCDIEMTGRERIPKHAPSVLTANHLSFIDPVLVSLTAHDNVRYLAVDELMGRTEFFDWLVGYWGAIPTPRGRPVIRAIRTALHQLEFGPVGVFPEGRRVSAWGEETPQRGAGWLSILTGAPLIPVSIYGTQNILSKTQPKFRPAPIHIWVEEPIWPRDHLDAVDPVGSMMEAWRSALDARLSPWFASPGLGLAHAEGHTAD
jgi:1-acyl-sn-glycerol-3-phosphate acyltransferase